MATIEFRHAVGKVYFDAGMTEDGKLIRKSKSYRNIAEGATADNLYIALTQLAQLSEYPLIGAERQEIADIMN
ncbi:DUF1659 domain-containing protein [Sporosarcina thermotolerans]|uniref:DUF1659 domain-containing protein n=1 Tax=Sporosarcina thermotolerans TaxID=633404 RepID=A0AAW9A8Z0_9BACL|nr:DUF1659 domain-containing protein [Sporosarcina thermotolerans]MDW0117455.1 DUF1659 domain-containing protein [Sporosarcina thermotolerans]WHT49633.1 DUF1659 domain-containing protein [Sporosarcina thermotolerans]